MGYVVRYIKDGNPQYLKRGGSYPEWTRDMNEAVVFVKFYEADDELLLLRHRTAGGRKYYIKGYRVVRVDA